MRKTDNADILQLKIVLVVLAGVICALAVLFAVVACQFAAAFRTAEVPQVQTTEPPGTFAPPAPNPYTPEDFREVDGYMTCITGTYSLGVDVSEYRGSINWEKVKNAGMEFAIIRVGGRGWGTGKLYPDGKAEEYYRGAKKAGLQVGVYFFSQAISVEEALEEAQYTLSLIEGWELDLPVVFDWEYVSGEARTANVHARTLTDCSLAFCRAVEESGREAMIYFNASQGRDLLYLEELTEYPFWLAMYDAPMNYPYEVEFWQYTKSGSVPGIQGGTDINILLPKRPMV